MKKFLSLVLALIMTMSLVTISAGAKDFTDDSKITYDTAIDVMTACKVVDGYADGSFNPSATLTRGAAAKIICNMILGPTTAGALKADAAPYKDVPADSTFAGYIAYCAKEGIISGYADGTFKPGNTLTGYAFMKMLLGALGYDKAIEGYEGANWSINVAKQALAIGLDDDLVGDFNGVKAVTREEACLYAFNTLQANTVKYDSQSSITVGDIVITNSSKVEDVTVVNPGTGDDLDGDGKVQFAEKYFPKLSKTSGYDDFGRPTKIWKYDSKKVAEDVTMLKKTYTSSVKSKTIYADLGLDTSLNSFNYYVNGTHVGTINLTKTSTDKPTTNGRGIVTEVFYKAGSADNRLVITESYCGKITSVAEDDDGRYVVVGGKKFHTEQFSKGDYVVYTSDGTNIFDLYLTEKQSGTVTKTVAGGTFYIDGVEYKTNESSKLAAMTASVKDKVDFYLDKNGYIVKLSATSSTASVDDLAWAVTGGPNKGEGYQKMYTIANGTSKVVDVKGSNYYFNQIVKFTLKDNYYELETVGHYYASAYTYTNGSATLPTGTKLDAKTTFLYINAKGDATVYTGIKEAPSFNSTTGVAVYCKDNDMSKVATLVVVNGGNFSTNSNKLTFFVRNADSKKVNEGDGKTYYTYNALTNNTITTLNVDDATANYIMDNYTDYYKNDLLVFKSYGVDTKGIVDYSASVTATDGVDYVRVRTVGEVSNNVIDLGGVAYAVADDIAVFAVDKDGVITASDIADIVEEADVADRYYYNSIFFTVNKDGEVDLIITCGK